MYDVFWKEDDYVPRKLLKRKVKVESESSDGDIWWNLPLQSDLENNIWIS